MRFDRLRLAGFKSFCDSTDFKIEQGLTGIVGPNGCGKSNLVEALRWVMGETSYKNMRASGMEDVIFAGSGKRPSRNIAEVSLVLDNSDRAAPAAFNDAETLEVSRRIERDAGSTYRVNGREVRARDVQLLFADASTGARSPALVRQGQIGEIISAKPQARRLILEEAAGVAGLHSRRHEAELRLKGAEDNLTRVEDVLSQLDAQIDSLKRQAKQSVRYRGLAADIRRHEALSRLIAWREADGALFEARQRLDRDLLEVAERTRAQSEAARLQAIAAAELPGRREDEARAGAALNRIVAARHALDAEEKRATDRVLELERRLAQWSQDLKREEALIGDAESVAERLRAEDRELEQHFSNAEQRQNDAARRRGDAEATLTAVEAAFAEAQAALSDLNARRNALLSALADDIRRVERLEAERANLAHERERLAASAPASSEREALSERTEAAIAALGDAEAAAATAETALAEAREREAALRAPLAERDRHAQRLQTEARTLERLLGKETGGLWPPVVDQISVARGYEAALGAALGDDLEASVNTSAPAHWLALPPVEADPPLPAGVTSLSEHVTAPLALERRLRQIGVVLRGEGKALSAQLRAGQRLVSREGDLWRWDGFVSAAEAPSAAARRLAEKNRLNDLAREGEAARQAAEIARAEWEAAQAALHEASAAEAAARQSLRERRAASESARSDLAAIERRDAETSLRLGALDDALGRAEASLSELGDRKIAAEAALRELAASDELAAKLDRARADAAEARAAAAEARADEQSLERELVQRRLRRQAIAAEVASWAERRERARAHVEDIDARREEALSEQAGLKDAPIEFARQRRALIAEVDEAEAARKTAADARALAETALSEADRAARAMLDALAEAREARAASEQRLEGARERQETLLAAIRADLDAAPHELGTLAQVDLDEKLPERSVVDRKLEHLKQERERLGAVNLRADDELIEVEATRDKLAAEKEDLSEAIKRLRGAIGSLNQEGRERLLLAFDVVNAHFKELFGTLFPGGAAELQLIESDDPLEAGLEILAKPPGKKPQTLTLLSGGEQALTAMSLIFAVFLTNPSPICVLDEVDAPLDDYNVERFCDLLDEMCKRADTRYVTITHNPITMARMDRLFGVTMAEQGVSQIVSVDLATAEQFREAS